MFLFVIFCVLDCGNSERSKGVIVGETKIWDNKKLLECNVFYASASYTLIYSFAVKTSKSLFL